MGREGKREIDTTGFTVTVWKQLTRCGNNQLKGYFSLSELDLSKITLCLFLVLFGWFVFVFLSIKERLPKIDISKSSL